MSFLSDIMTYWAANATLTAAIPAASVYTGIVSDSVALPFVSITSISSVYQWTTGTPYLEDYRFQITIWAGGLATAESLAAIVARQFDWVKVSATCLGCERTNYLPLTDPESQRTVYGVMLEYIMTKQQAQGA